MSQPVSPSFPNISYSTDCFLDPHRARIQRIINHAQELGWTCYCSINGIGYYWDETTDIMWKVSFYWTNPYDSFKLLDSWFEPCSPLEQGQVLTYGRTRGYKLGQRK